jgi:hypothetical protein
LNPLCNGSLFCARTADLDPRRTPREKVVPRLY